MVLMAYLAGLATPLAALAGVTLGLAWWARLRRAQGLSDGPVKINRPPTTPTPGPPQNRPVQNRVSYASKLGPQRALRAKPRRTG